MALPNFRINPYIQPYVGSPNAEAATLLDKKIQEYDANQQQDDVLGYATDSLIQNVLPHPADQAYAKKLMNDVRLQIEDRTKQGDYENMGRAVRRSARNFQAQVEPLLNRRKQYDAYVKSLGENKKIGEDTRQRALQYSMQNSGDPQSGIFNGFNPDDDINVSEKVDKAISGMAANGGETPITFTPDGSTYVTKKWKELIPREIDIAAQQYLQGDSEFGNYIRTQSQLNNHERVNNEVGAAIEAAKTKYGFHQSDLNYGFTPEHILKRVDGVNYLDNPSSTSIPPTQAIQIRNEYEGAKLNPLDGRLGQDNDYYTLGKDGIYTKFIDEAGNTVKQKTVWNKTGSAYPGGRPATPEQVGFKQVIATSQEVTSFTNEVNKKFDNAVQEYYAYTHAPESYDHTGKMAYARVRILNMSNEEIKNLRKAYKENYDAAQSNKNIVTEKWLKQTYDTPDKEQKITEGNLSGKGIAVISNLDKDGPKLNLPEGSDINELYRQLADEGWRVKGDMINTGFLKANPKSFDKPGQHITIQIAKGTGEKEQNRTLDLVATLNKGDATPNLDFQQRVMSQVLSGNSGFINVDPEHPKAGYRIVNIPIKGQDGQQGHISKVIEYDSDGKETPDGNVPADAFPDWWVKHVPAAKEELKQYLLK